MRQETGVCYRLAAVTRCHRDLIGGEAGPAWPCSGAGPARAQLGITWLSKTCNGRVRVS